MRVTKAPPIEFKCESCSALNEGDEGEFTYQHTMPPAHGTLDVRSASASLFAHHLLLSQNLWV